MQSAELWVWVIASVDANGKERKDKKEQVKDEPASNI